jgi:hypothetical protein
MGVHARDADLGEGAARIPSAWMALTRSFDTLSALYLEPERTNLRWRWVTCEENPSARPWTDDRTAVIEALFWRRDVGQQSRPK